MKLKLFWTVSKTLLSVLIPGGDSIKGSPRTGLWRERSAEEEIFGWYEAYMSV
jgi:hypothetical protein